MRTPNTKPPKVGGSRGAKGAGKAPVAFSTCAVQHSLRWRAAHQLGHCERKQQGVHQARCQ